MEHHQMLETVPTPESAVLRDESGVQVATAAELDISDMSADELQRLAAQLRREAERRKDAERAAYAVSIREQIRAAGYTLGELGLHSVQIRERKARRANGEAVARPSMAGQLQPKYRELGGGGRTWVGRGKPPGWFRAAIASGVTREQMLIGGAA